MSPQTALTRSSAPNEFDWDGSFIKNDDLAAVLGGLAQGVYAEIILDSCHSGAGTREIVLDRESLTASVACLGDEKALWFSRHCIRPRCLAPPSDVAPRADHIYSEPQRLRRVREPRRGARRGVRYIPRPEGRRRARRGGCQGPVASILSYGL